MKEVHKSVQEGRQALKAAANELRTALAPLLELENYFPEVCTYIKSGLPQELFAVWRPDLTIEMFEVHQTLASGSNHTVYKASMGGKTYALKEFRLDSVRGLQQLMREAAMLRKMRHPAIVEIVSIFEDNSSKGSKVMLLQMPFFEHGTLDTWVRTEVPKWHLVRTVLLDVAGALEYLHSASVVHCDVKPPNILVAPNCRGRLADFDISVDSATRTSTMCAATKAAYTAGFDAPELAKTGSTFATDMFAFGCTIACVESACNPSSSQQAVLAASIISSLTAANPLRRMRACDVLQHDFFSPANISLKTQTAKCDMCLGASCPCGHIKTSMGVTCSLNQHFLCSSCLETLAVKSTQHGGDDSMANLSRLSDGKIHCPHCLAQQPRVFCDYADSQLAKALPATLFNNYLRTRMQLVEDRRICELEAGMEQKIKQELERLQKMDKQHREVLAARKHLEQNILQTKCPSCEAAFYDFDGCFALKCGSCPMHFCGWCIEGCFQTSQDAHQHVAKCAHKPREADSYYGSRNQFEESLRKRWQSKITSYVATLPASVCDELLRDIQPLLKERNLHA
jgi:serine/threonine protein kinase